MDTIDATNHTISADRSAIRKGGADRTLTIIPMIDYVIGAAGALALIGYLLVALLRPEKF